MSRPVMVFESRAFVDARLRVLQHRDLNLPRAGSMRPQPKGGINFDDGTFYLNVLTRHDSNGVNNTL